MFQRRSYDRDRRLSLNMPGSVRIDSVPSAVLSLTTLGITQLSRALPGGDSTVLLGPGKPLAMLIYLHLAPGRASSREHLIDILWADLNMDAARHALRQAVWYLRQRLGDDALLTRNGELVLQLSLEVDRDAFLAALDRADLEQAVRLYAGDFLADFATPGGVEFEHWADVERYRLHLLFASAAEPLVRRHLTAGKFRDARQIAERLRDLGRQRQKSWRLLLETLLSGGESLTAVVEAQALRQMLESENRQPEPATADLLRIIETPNDEAGTLGDSETSEQRAAALHAELVGREAEFSTIVRAWEATRAGTSQHIHITASAGLGKTRLLRDVASRLRAAGARIAAVRAHPGQRNIGYTVAGDLAAALAALPGSKAISTASAATLIGLNPTLSSLFGGTADAATGEEAQRRRTMVIGELIAAVADEQPLAVLVDDIHWTDDRSRQVLQGIVGRLDAGRILMVTTARQGPHGVLGDRRSIHLSLAPLTQQQVTQVLASLGSLPVENRWAQLLPAALHGASSGSPLLLLEALELAIERNGLALESGMWSCPNEAILLRDLEAGGALANRIAQLERNAGWLLELLAVAGTPLTSDQLVNCVDAPAEVTLAHLTTLEQRGFVSRIGDYWEPAHDEIAGVVLNRATPQASRAAHSVLGQVLVRDGVGDRRVAAHAVRHFVASDDLGEAVQVFTDFVRLTRSRGDRRGVHELAREVLPNGVSPHRIRELVNRLPLTVRMSGARKRFLAAAAFGIVSLVSLGPFLLFAGGEAIPDAELVVSGPNETHGSNVYAVPIYLARWTVNSAIDVARDGRRVRALELTAPQSFVKPQPGGTGWIIDQVFPDSGGSDLVLVQSSGATRRLTYSPGDDTDPDWSPDGRLVVFQTARWQPMSWYDLALLDVASGDVRPLVRDDWSYYGALWSPDGTRIAYMKNLRRSGESRLCWVTVDGTRSACHRRSVESGSGILGVGWIDERKLLVGISSPESVRLATLDVDADSLELLALDFPQGTEFTLSGGGWVAVARPGTATESRRWSIHPLNRPELTRPLDLAGLPAGEYRVTWASTDSRPWIERLALSVPADGVPVTAGYYFHVTAYDRDGTPLPAMALTFESSDTSVALIDAGGLLLPRSAGQTVVRVSAGGWRSVEAVVPIRVPSARTLLEEVWESGLADRWMPYGDPSPTIAVGPNAVPALWNRGDGSYLSGVHSKMTFPAGSGLGMEVYLSSPVDSIQWQDVRVALAAVDSGALAAWDHEINFPPGMPTNATGISCGLTYPAAERRDRLRFLAGLDPLVPAPAGLDSGEWWRLRLQLFPDGTCGMAVNGTPLARTTTRFPLDDPYYVFLDGSSRWTKTLHGPVEVWQGVREDIDWRILHEPPNP